MATTPAEHLKPHAPTSLQVLAARSPAVFRLIVGIISGVVGVALLSAIWASCSYFRQSSHCQENIHGGEGSVSLIPFQCFYGARI